MHCTLDQDWPDWMLEDWEQACASERDECGNSDKNCFFHTFVRYCFDNQERIYVVPEFDKRAGDALIISYIVYEYVEGKKFNSHPIFFIDVWEDETGHTKGDRIIDVQKGY